MNAKKFSDAMSELDTKYVDEALNYKKKAKKPIWVKWGAIAACLCLMIPLTAFAVDIIQYNAAVDYLNSLGIAVEDLSDYSHKEIKEAAKTIDAGESNPLTEEILSLIPENKEPLDTPTQVTSEQIKELTPTMTREDVLSLLGDTQDVGSGIYIYLYEVDQQYLLRIPFASDEAQLGVTGEDLLKALVPISGDIAPMVYVNDTLYQIVDSQSNLADEKSSFNLLGKIENTVSSSEEPKENFQANDDIVGAAVYQYGDIRTMWRRCGRRFPRTWTPPRSTCAWARRGSTRSISSSSCMRSCRRRGICAGEYTIQDWIYG